MPSQVGAVGKREPLESGAQIAVMMSREDRASLPGAKSPALLVMQCSVPRSMECFN